jgi:hypothetical protein
MTSGGQVAIVNAAIPFAVFDRATRVRTIGNSIRRVAAMTYAGERAKYLQVNAGDCADLAAAASD